jgi:hypothetical protein
MAPPAGARRPSIFVRSRRRHHGAAPLQVFRPFRLFGPFRRIAAGVAAGVLLAAGASARVYWRSNGGPLGEGPDPAWTRVYSAEWRINEGAAQVDAWSTRMDLDEIAAQLKARAEKLGGAAFASATPDLAWGIACGNGRVVRYLVTTLDSPNCVAFVTEQSFEDFRASVRPPSRHLLRAVEPYPGSEPESFYASTATTLALETSLAAALPAEVRRHYAQALAADGWGAVRAPGGAGDGGADLYLKGAELVVVRALSAGGGGGSRIMVFHKRIGAARSEAALRED